MPKYQNYVPKRLPYMRCSKSLDSEPRCQICRVDKVSAMPAMFPSELASGTICWSDDSTIEPQNEQQSPCVQVNMTPKLTRLIAIQINAEDSIPIQEELEEYESKYFMEYLCDPNDLPETLDDEAIQLVALINYNGSPVPDLTYIINGPDAEEIDDHYEDDDYSVVKVFNSSGSFLHHFARFMYRKFEAF